MTGKLNAVLVGGGRVGQITMYRLTEQGHDVTVIERDPARCDELADEYQATIVQGDATDPAILEQANLEATDVIGAATGQTGTNLAICLEAKELAPGIRTVARVDRDAGKRYSRFADAVVYPERAGGRMVADAMSGSDVRTLSEAPGDLELLYIRVAEGAPAAGKRLEEIQLPRGCLVVSTEAGDRVASAETRLQQGERYLVAVEPDVTDEVVNLFRS
jgi:trk system potassium uptake protein TrkA